ncbi:RICIN domain-containing protein [Streptomyces anulatus]
MVVGRGGKCSSKKGRSLMAVFTAALVARHSDKAVSVTASGMDDGAEVVQWTDKNKPNQEWKLVQKDDGYFSLEARHSGKLLSVVGEDTADGAKLVQWTDKGKPNQHFRLG